MVLSRHVGLDHERMWAFARDLLGRVYSALDGDDVLIDGLDAVVRLLQTDRGLVFLADGDGVMKALVGRRWRRRLAPSNGGDQQDFRASGPRHRRRRAVGRAHDADAHREAPSLGIIICRAVAPIGLEPMTARASSTSTSAIASVVDERHVELFVAAAAVSFSRRARRAGRAGPR